MSDLAQTTAALEERVPTALHRVMIGPDCPDVVTAGQVYAEVAIHNGKGGVGKPRVAVNLAVAFARAGLDDGRPRTTAAAPVGTIIPCRRATVL
jgi:Mrp family chromosome partitioning ATPase